MKRLFQQVFSPSNRSQDPNSFKRPPCFLQRAQASLSTAAKFPKTNLYLLNLWWPWNDKQFTKHCATFVLLINSIKENKTTLVICFISPPHPLFPYVSSFSLYHCYLKTTQVLNRSQESTHQTYDQALLNLLFKGERTSPYSRSPAPARMLWY